MTPTMVIKNLKRIHKGFKLGRQEDAHEFMRCTLDLLQSAEPAVVFVRGESRLSVVWHGVFAIEKGL